MIERVYLALYKRKVPVTNWTTFKERAIDEIVRCFTKSPYSHCEMVIDRGDGYYDCYSSSPREKGVRNRRMKLDEAMWVLIPVEISENKIKQFYQKTKGKKYDLLGAFSIALVFTKHRKNRYFCSEWCWEAMGGKEGWRFSPADLATLINFLNNGENHER